MRALSKVLSQLGIAGVFAFIAACFFVYADYMNDHMPYGGHVAMRLFCAASVAVLLLAVRLNRRSMRID